jgi:alanine-glyoxylate transaminase/serine-glyoxylate transaminase/serine-pyruvate transaminase
MLFALHEALRTILEEGLEACFHRHQLNHAALVADLEAMELELLVAPQHRAPSLTTLVVTDGVDEARLRAYVLDEHCIKIGEGLRELKGRIWRSGLMGYSSRRRAVERLLSGLDKGFAQAGHRIKEGESRDAAERVYSTGI